MRDIERLIPSANMGEYEAARDRPEDGGLYPLNAEGTYGRVPRNRHPGRWTELPKYQKREKKPKLYASYAISDKCELHSLVLDKYMRPPSCAVHSSSTRGSSLQPSSRSTSRASSAPPQELAREEVAKARKATRKVSEGEVARKVSLPPVQVGTTVMLKVEELDMLARLQLAREREEDSMDNLVDAGEEEEEEGEEEEEERVEEDEETESLTRSLGSQSMDSLKVVEDTIHKMERKRETYMESTGLVLQEDAITTYVV